MKLDFSLIKKHPLASGAVILVGGVGLYFVAFRGSSNAAPTTVVTSGVSSQEALQQAQLQASLAQTQSNNNFQLAYLAEQIKGQLAISALQGNQQLQLASAQLAEKSNEDNLTYALQSQDLASQVQALKIQTQAAVDQSQINAQLQTNLASLTSNTQITLGQQNVQMYQALQQTQQYIAHQQENASEHSSNNQMWGSIAGAAVMALAFM